MNWNIFWKYLLALNPHESVKKGVKLNEELSLRMQRTF